MSILEESSLQIQSLGIFPKEAGNTKYMKTSKENLDVGGTPRSLRGKGSRLYTCSLVNLLALKMC